MFVFKCTFIHSFIHIYIYIYIIVYTILLYTLIIIYQNNINFYYKYTYIKYIKYI